MRPFRNQPLRLIAPALIASLMAVPTWAAEQPETPSSAKAPGGSSEEGAAPQVAPSLDKPSLLLLPVGLGDTPERAAMFAAQLGEDQGRALGRFTIRELIQVLDREARDQEERQIGKARQLLAEAQAAYDELDLALSKEKGLAAITLIERSDLSRHFDLLVQAKMLQIAAHLADAELREAERTLRELLPMDLETPFDPNLFAPDYIAQIKSERMALAKARPADLDVEIKPVAARVYIDGKFMGVTPLERLKLVPGTHLLTILAPGYQRLQKAIHVQATEAVSETLEPTAQLVALQPALEKLRQNFWDSKQRAATAAELTSLFEVDQVMFLGAQTKGGDAIALTGVRVDARDGHEYAYGSERFSNEERRFTEEAAPWMKSLLSTDRARQKGGKAVQTTGGGFEWRTRHTGYLLLGLAVAMAGNGLGFGLDAQHQAATYRDYQLPQTHPIYGRLETRGKRSALIADVSFLAAILTGGTGLFLALTGQGNSADVVSTQIDDKARVARTSGAERAEEALPPRPRSEKAGPPPKVAPEPIPERAPAGKPSSGFDDDDLRDDW